MAALRKQAKPEALLAIALYVAGACVFFRQRILSGFDFYFADHGDPRLILRAGNYEARDPGIRAA